MSLPTEDFEAKDQGYTRAKILILVPFKRNVADIVNEIVMQYNNNRWKRVINKKKFKQEYQEGLEDEFNDNVKMGIQINQGSIKLFTGFFDSDIIIASPLGLRLLDSEKADGREVAEDEEEFK